MNGDLLIRVTIWLALFCYVGTGFLLHARKSRIARSVWTAGGLLFLVHGLSAYHYAYGWDHGAALADTARQSLETTGMEAAWGMYLNFVLVLLWIADAGYWWKAGLSAYTERSCWISWTLHGFFLFMIINGAIVFADGAVRWVSAVLLLLLAASFIANRCRRA